MMLRGAQAVGRSLQNLSVRSVTLAGAGAGLAFGAYHYHSTLPRFHAKEEFDDLYHEPIFDNPFLPPTSDDTPLAVELEALAEAATTPTPGTDGKTPIEPSDDEELPQASSAPENSAEEPTEVEEPTEDPVVIPPPARTADEKAQILELLREILRQEKDILTADQLLILEEKIATKYKKKLKKVKQDMKRQLHDAVQVLEQQAEDYVQELPTVQSLKEQLEAKRAEKIQEMEKEADDTIAACQKQLNEEFESKIQLLEQMTQYEARVTLNELRSALLLEEQRAADKREAFARYLDGRVSQLSQDITEFQKRRVRDNSSRIQDLLILSIGDRLRMNQSYATPLAQLRSVTKQGGQLAEVLDRFPSERPQLSLGQLVESFGEVKKEALWLSFLPTDGRRNLRDRVVANVFSTLTVPLKGKVRGNETEAILARAEYYLHKGNVFQAIQTLQQLQGPPREAIFEWCASSADYLQTQGALSDLQEGL